MQCSKDAHLKDLRDIDGQRLFPDRHAGTVTFRLNHEEFELYKAVTAYINEFLPQATDARSKVWLWLAPFSKARLLRPRTTRRELLTCSFLDRESWVSRVICTEGRRVQSSTNLYHRG